MFEGWDQGRSVPPGHRDVCANGERKRRGVADDHGGSGNRSRHCSRSGKEVVWGKSMEARLHINSSKPWFSNKTMVFDRQFAQKIIWKPWFRNKTLDFV